MDLQLEGMTALVTGASRGIGLATTKTLVDEGVRVLAVARTSTAALEATGAVTVSADLLAPGSPARVVSEAVERFGGLDILVNNVGGGDPGAPDAGFSDHDDDFWHRTFELNLFTAVRIARAALPALVTRRGAIVNVSSDSARRPHTAPLAYGAAKAALNAFSKGLAEELGPHGVRVNVVTPSSTRTSLWEGEGSFGSTLAQSMDISVDELIAAMPAQMGMLTGRFIEPEEIASAIAYLASPQAASVLGANWVVDAGVSKYV